MSSVVFGPTVSVTMISIVAFPTTFGATMVSVVASLATFGGASPVCSRGCNSPCTTDHFGLIVMRRERFLTGATTAVVVFSNGRTTIRVSASRHHQPRKQHERRYDQCTHVRSPYLVCVRMMWGHGSGQIIEEISNGLFADIERRDL